MLPEVDNIADLFSDFLDNVEAMSSEDVSRGKKPDNTLLHDEGLQCV